MPLLNPGNAAAIQVSLTPDEHGAWLNGQAANNPFGREPSDAVLAGWSAQKFGISLIAFAATYKPIKGGSGKASTEAMWS